MTEQAQFRALNRGEMEVLADGGVRWCGKYSGDMYHLAANELRGRGADSAEDFAQQSNALSGYKIIAPATIGPFGSGASLKTDGNQITGRIEPQPDPAAANHATPAEPKRVPLDWNKPTPFDAFKGFEVSRFDPDDWAGPEHSHPLQRMTADSPTHGSAHLLAKP